MKEKKKELKKIVKSKEKKNITPKKICTHKVY